MTKLILLLGALGGIILFVGIKVQDKQARTLGMFLLGVALLLVLLSSVGNINIFPQDLSSPPATPALTPQF